MQQVERPPKVSVIIVCHNDGRWLPRCLESVRAQTLFDDAELIIACNTDPRAPIFDVAHYGTTLDLFDLVPALREALGG